MAYRMLRAYTLVFIAVSQFFACLPSLALTEKDDALAWAGIIALEPLCESYENGGGDSDWYTETYNYLQFETGNLFKAQYGSDFYDTVKLHSGKEPKAFLKVAGQAIANMRTEEERIRLCSSAHLAVDTKLPMTSDRIISNLLDRYRDADGACRGQSGDDPATLRACDTRDRIGRHLDHRNWCYGRSEEVASEMKWHRCGLDSNRPK